MKSRKDVRHIEKKSYSCSLYKHPRIRTYWTGYVLSFARDGYACMLNLCPDEYSLFYNFFFSIGEDGLYGNLEFRFVM
ncbi:conserved oligomeric Golgi complex subunit [Rhizophagus irregularis DAOM 181602=DAOM 197198]|uniref:Uncharacterized protein n=1 Tax=Rhizophagus irregularis (strain DAOM 181602 / DAOM 197198 / MUCL 43194) TaxID=747089 RepID=U9UJN7_RHIID|nr:conserved oligomeric Golgi complex subunit [Rhizophagus irregularis DAOM 181602=DAOM 197198]